MPNLSAAANSQRALIKLNLPNLKYVDIEGTPADIPTYLPFQHFTNCLIGNWRRASNDKMDLVPNSF